MSTSRTIVNQQAENKCDSFPEMGWKASETDQKLPMTIRIIGGGIVGLSVAYHLSQTTGDITVFEIDKSYERALLAAAAG